MRIFCISILIGVLSLFSPLFAQNPITEIISPKANETYRVGDTIVVEWKVDDDNISQGIVVEFSLTGAKWIQISRGEALPNTTTKIEWIIEDSIRYYDYGKDGWANISPVSDSCRIKVYEYDGEGLKTDRFTIKSITENTPTNPPPKKETKGCGTGVGIAFIPPFCYRIVRFRRKKRK